MNHLSFQEIQEFVEGNSSVEHELHVRTCKECGTRIEAFRAFERTLRTLPLEKASQKFTENVMQRAGIRQSSTFTWVIFKNLAPMVALTLVVGIILTVFKFTGAFSSTDAAQTSAAAHQISDAVGTGVQTMNGWMSKYFSFAFARSTYGLTAFVLVFFGIVALIDKHFLMPMMRRKA